MNEIVKKINKMALMSDHLVADVNVDRVIKNLKKSHFKINVLSDVSLSKMEEGKGIYYFEAKFPFNTLEELEQFGSKWGRPRDNDAPKNMPRYFSKRAEKHKIAVEKSNFLPFYLGKQKNIRERIANHINCPSNSTTFSLKLKQRPKLISKVKFRVGYVMFNIKDNGYFCIELIEKAIRKKLNPIIGKQ